MRMFVLLISSAVVLAAATAAVSIRAVDGSVLNPFRPAGKANAIFFVSTDCPVSNSYAPEIQRLCREYGTRGVGCSLIYEDVGVNAATVRKHLDEFRYRGIPAAIDGDRKIAKEAKATVTPEAVVIDAKGDVRYRGRINNLYADLGKPRQVVTVHDLSDALSAVLAGKTVAIPQVPALGCYIVDP